MKLLILHKCIFKLYNILFTNLGVHKKDIYSHFVHIQYYFQVQAKQGGLPKCLSSNTLPKILLLDWFFFLWWEWGIDIFLYAIQSMLHMLTYSAISFQRVNFITLCSIAIKASSGHFFYYLCTSKNSKDTFTTWSTKYIKLIEEKNYQYENTQMINHSSTIFLKKCMKTISIIQQ